MYKESYFDGGLFSYIGHVILATLITVFTLGICAPWGMCILYNWKIKHTVIDGHRLYFDGTANAAFWKLDQVVAPDHCYLWYLWLLAENQTDPVDYQAYTSCELRQAGET